MPTQRVVRRNGLALFVRPDMRDADRCLKSLSFIFPWHTQRSFQTIENKPLVGTSTKRRQGPARFANAFSQGSDAYMPFELP
jgi:hypothetical protein